ncbi:hypothetical protein CDAR_507321 [Caerostris darwini]|uniref:Uncharacterized protein n=1 Tax=Caerostris darwini TaxID=1538125 RepID=A0AAV4WDW0_9ARAC|nr:hypothetical protein CDAR_507321 [Caerostris darwini]
MLSTQGVKNEMNGRSLNIHVNATVTSQPLSNEADLSIRLTGISLNKRENGISTYKEDADKIPNRPEDFNVRLKKHFYCFQTDGLNGILRRISFKSDSSDSSTAETLSYKDLYDFDEHDLFEISLNESVNSVQNTSSLADESICQDEEAVLESCEDFHFKRKKIHEPLEETWSKSSLTNAINTQINIIP